MRILMLAAFAAANLTTPALAQRTPGVDLAHMMSLARVWGEAYYFHPALGQPSIAWDSIGAAAIHAAESARTPSEFASVVAAMVAPLHDPVTRVVTVAPSKRAARAAEPPSVAWSMDGNDSVLVLRIGSAYGGAARRSSLRTLYQASPLVGRARRVVVDLRGTDPVPPNILESIFGTAFVESALLDHPICGVAVRRRQYVGFPTPGSVVPSAGWRDNDARCFRAASTASKAGVVFLADSTSAIPPLALAMRAANLASIVSTSLLTDEALVTVDTIAIAPGVGVQMRLSAPAGCFETGRLADSIVTREPLDAAVAITAHRPPARSCAEFAGGARPVVFDTATPPRPWRILAAFEIYNGIRFFDPHQDLIAGGGNWDSVFTANLPAIADATTRHAYLGVVDKFAAALNDGHAPVPGNQLQELFGPAYPPFEVRRIEGRLVVKEIFDSPAAPRIHRGDVLYAIDGADATAHFADVRQYVSGSNAAARDLGAVRFVLAGPDSSIATLVLGDVRGPRDTVRVTRHIANISRVFNPWSGPVLRDLAHGAVGYADLGRLSVPEVDSMFQRFARTRALILDLRSYPQVPAPAIAGRLTRKDVIIARVRRPFVDAQDRAPALRGFAMEQTSRAFEEGVQRILPEARGYAGRVFVLMDEGSQSQAEQSAVVYKITGATLVGSNTAGADGSYATFYLPGSIPFSFTSEIALEPDGTPIQGAGVKADVRVRPTIAGIRAGRDELLDCALALATGARNRCGK